jgi:4-oxalocrotonate tautomerase
MPVITVDMWKGRTKEQKKMLAEKITTATMDAISCPKDAVQVILNEVDKDNWMIGGKLCSESMPGK